MQTYIVSFAILLCLGISVRLLHSGSVVFSAPPFYIAAFLGLGALLSLVYRNRVIAFLLLLGAICAALLGLPIDTSFNEYFIGAFVALAATAIGLNLLKIKGILPWMLSALILGYGLTGLHKDADFPTHLAKWATDGYDRQSLIYGTIVKEPEIRPDRNDTRLTIQPAVVAHLDNLETKTKISGIIEVLNSLGRQWNNEGEALETLIEARDGIVEAAVETLDAGTRGEIITTNFSTEEFSLQPEGAAKVERVIRKLGIRGDPNTRSWLLEPLTELGRTWESESGPRNTLLKTRDDLVEKGVDSLPAARKAEIIIDAFSAGDYTLPADYVGTVEAALAALTAEDDPLGLDWIGRITRGWIFATVRDTEEQAQTYLDVSYYTGYGDVVKVIGGLRTPYPASNPGGFDYQSMLNNTNYFSMMTITGQGSRDREADTIEIIEERMGNPFIAWCLSIKYKLLDVIRQTTPFPDSGFLSGIFLGLRRGVPEKIMQDSRVAGTAHVFAVSGLHVTIITGLLLLIFSQTPIPKTIWAPIAVIFLCVFTVITGARPSTLRAATMNIFVLVFFTYFGSGILKSLIMSICFAAIVILTIFPAGYGGPLIMPEASFLMSFSAVLFLGMLSQPVEHFLNTRLNSLGHLLLFASIWVVVGLFFLNLENPLAIFTSKLLWVMLGITVAGFVLQNFLPFRVRFTSIPSLWLRQFIAAQIAIQCSIIPLSAVIFHRISLAAPFANFVAIPLIGIVLPLGMLASLIGLIPGIGIYIALLLTAANWLGMRFFLIWDDLWAKLLPYPQVPEWGAPVLVGFYAAVLIFIYREKISLNLKIAFFRVKNSLADGKGARIRFGVAGAALLLAAATLTLGFKAGAKPNLSITFLDLDYPSHGVSTIVTTPDGKNYLIDGGFEGIWGTYYKRYVNQGERGVADVLLAQGILSFEAVINSNFDSSLLGGINFILRSDDYRVKKLYVYIPPDRFGPTDINLNRFKEALTHQGKARAEELYELMLLGYWNDPTPVLEFEDFFRNVERAELDAFISELGSQERTLAENALMAFDEKAHVLHEELIESIIATYSVLLNTEMAREAAEEVAVRWEMPTLSTEDYRSLVTELPRIVVWFIYQKAGLIADIQIIDAYLTDLEKKFVEAVGDTKELYRGDEKFLQYHRLMFTAMKKDLDLSSFHYGLQLIKPQKVGGALLKAEFLNPPPERFQGQYVSDANSAVIRFQYGDYSVLFTSRINREASEWLLGLKDGIKATIYQVPESGMGGRFINTARMLDEVAPELAVFHTKDAKYPNQRYHEVLDVCAEKNVMTLSTAETGAVIVTIYPDSYQVESTLGGTVDEGIEVGEDNAAPDREKEMGVGF